MRTASKILLSFLVLQYALPHLTFFSVVPSAYAQEIPGDDASFKERKAEEGFTLDLKSLIERSKKKIEQVDDKLLEQARERRNQQREAKAREYFEKATELYEQGEFDKARELWEKAIKITEHVEMEDYINQSVRRQKVQEKALRKAEKRRMKRLEQERGYTAKEVNKKYKDAVKFYRDEKLLAAKVAFEEVDEMFPDHKATRSYLALINDGIEAQQKKMIENKLKDKTFTSAKAKARWKKELEEQERERQKEIRGEAEKLYKEAVSLYKDKQFKAAKDKFKEIEWMLPDYKQTIKYLARIDGDIKKHGVKFSEEDKVKFFKREYKRMRDRDEWAAKNKVDPKVAREFTEDRRRREEAAFVYDSALTLYNKDYHKQALEKFYEVQALYPDYKKTKSYIRKLHKKVPGSENEFTKLQAQAEKTVGKMYSPAPGVNEQVVRAINEEERQRIEKAEDKYKQALAFYKKRNFVEAQRKFIAVESILPGYKATRDYLKHIDGDIAKQQNDSGKKNKISTKLWKNKSDSAKDDAHKRKYRQAKKFYATGQWQQAKDKFEEVNHLKPGYRGTNKYLARIEKKMKLVDGVEKKSESARKTQKTSDEMTYRNVAKKVEPIPGMNSGVPKNYPDKAKMAMETTSKSEQIDKALTQAAMSDVKISQATPSDTQKVMRSPKNDLGDQMQTKPLSDVEVKKLKTNRKKLSKMRKEAEEKGVLSKHEKKVLRDNRKEIDKQISRQQKKSMRKLTDVIDDTYKEALGLYKLEQYAAAKAKFATVEGLKPGYKSAAEYMRKSDKFLSASYQQLPDDIEPRAKKPTKKVPENKMKKGGPVASKDSSGQQQMVPRKKTLQELAAEIDDNYYHPMSEVEYSRRMNEATENRGDEIRQARELRKERVASLKKTEEKVYSSIAELSEEELKTKYQLGKRLYNAKNYRKAKTVFAQISERQPDYKGTARYMHKIDIILDREKVKREKYQQKMTNKHSEVPALTDSATIASVTDADKKIKRQTEDYIKAQKRRANKKQNEMWEPPKRRGGSVGVPSVDSGQPAYVKGMVKDLYKDAKNFYAQKDFAEAQSFFMRVEQLSPNYKRTREYLNNIQEMYSAQMAAASGQSMMKGKDSPGDHLPKIPSQKKRGFGLGIGKESSSVPSDEYSRNKSVQEYKELAKYNQVDVSSGNYQKLRNEIVKGEKEQLREAKRERKAREKEIRRAKRDNRKQKSKQSLSDPAAHDYHKMVQKGQMSEREARRQAKLDRRQQQKDREALEQEHVRMAKLDRRARQQQDELQRQDERNIYRDLLKAQESDQEILLEEQEKARRDKENRARNSEKQRRLEERRAKKEIDDKIRADVMDVKELALNALEDKKDAEAQLHINKFEELIDHSGFSFNEKRRMKKTFAKQRKRIEKRLNKEREREENSILARTNLSRQEKNKLSIKQQRELEKLESRILTEQKKLEQARAEEKKRLAKIDKVKQQPVAAMEDSKADGHNSPKRSKAINEALDSVNVAKTQSPDVETLAEMEKRKRKEIEELVKQRQKALQAKRKRVQKEFDKSLVDMYKKGIRLYKKGIYEQSAEIFVEIQNMRPGYKKVREYLSRIDEALVEQRAAQFQKQFQTHGVSQGSTQVALPTTKAPKKVNRLQRIRNALDEFEEKMW